jgi:hypothetical protein
MLNPAFLKGGVPVPGCFPSRPLQFVIAIFVADTVTNIDIAVAVLYVAVVLMAARFCKARGVVMIGAGCVGLTVLSNFLTPPGGDEVKGIINTAISIATIGLTTVLALQGQLAEARLREQAILLDLTHDIARLGRRDYLLESRCCGALWVERCLGSPIVLAPPNDMLGLAICEGVEDALSIHRATGLGAWAAGGATRFPSLANTVPEYIEAVTVVGHDDADLCHASAERIIRLPIGACPSPHGQRPPVHNRADLAPAQALRKALGAGQAREKEPTATDDIVECPLSSRRRSSGIANQFP